jgi:hypothetical protein
MAAVFLKSLGIWLLIVVAAIFNGLVREAILHELLGAGPALAVSGLTL